MATFNYPVFAFKQTAEAPVQVAFLAPAADILQWAGVPRKSDELLSGYQRFRDDKRVNEEMVPFFRDPKNCSPTAIILALRTASVGGNCELKLDGAIETGKIAHGTLSISLNVDEGDPNRLLTAALAYVNQRLSGSTAAEAAATEDQIEAEAENNAGADDAIADRDQNEEEEDEESGGEQAIHFGNETLARIKRLLEDHENWAKPEFRKAISDYVKPAFLIDGQHRLTAAAQLGLPFIVCGLFDAPWEEQMFQFTVVNLKPRKIPPNTIAAISALSLTRTEQAVLETRLERAGVKMWELTLMSHVTYDPASPFFEKVDLAAGGRGSGRQKLVYGPMKRIAAVWYRCRNPMFAHIARAAAGTSNTAKARREWQQKDWWFSFFCAFWQTIRNQYPARLWQKTNTNGLFNEHALWVLQDVLLTYCGIIPSSFWKLNDVFDEHRLHQLKLRMRDSVEHLVSQIPEELWSVSERNCRLITQDRLKSVINGRLRGRRPVDAA